mmetsp:Transcript_46730/g.92268  ORF Transcript_46730/g.92268 Transcript_46730/m.92268 type:complete len:163 (+) Transcript_46730:1352-1840(+)
MDTSIDRSMNGVIRPTFVFLLRAWHRGCMWKDDQNQDRKRERRRKKRQTCTFSEKNRRQKARTYIKSPARAYFPTLDGSRKANESKKSAANTCRKYRRKGTLEKNECQQIKKPLLFLIQSKLKRRYVNQTAGGPLPPDAANIKKKNCCRTHAPALFLLQRKN